jgi:hypothetical protein
MEVGRVFRTGLRVSGRQEHGQIGVPRGGQVRAHAAEVPRRTGVGAGYRTRSRGRAARRRTMSGTGPASRWRMRSHCSSPCQPLRAESCERRRPDPADRDACERSLHGSPKGIEPPSSRSQLLLPPTTSRGGPFVCDTPNDLVTCLAMPALRAGGRLRRSAQPLPIALPCASSAANLRVTEVVRVHRAVRHAGAVVTAPGRAAASTLRRPGYVVGSRCKCLACTRPPVRGLITPIGRYVCASRALPCRS